MTHLTRYVPLLLLCLLFLACHDDDDVSVGSPTFSLLPETTVRFVQADSLPLRFERVASVDSLVLEARLFRDPFPGAVDDEHDLVLNIPLSADRQRFSYTGEDIPLASAFLSYENCFCGASQPIAISSGVLAGERQDTGIWRVLGSVTTETGFVYDVGGIYRIR